jgi:hypothetical protein
LLPPQPVGPIPSRSRPWGFPFGALIPPCCRTPSRMPRPSRVVLAKAIREHQHPSQGLAQPSEPVCGSRGLAGYVQNACPLGFHCSGASYLVRRCVGKHAPSPLALFRFSRKTASSLAPQGIDRTGRSHSLARLTNPRAVFHLVGPAGYGKPQDEDLNIPPVTTTILAMIMEHPATSCIRIPV